MLRVEKDERLRGVMRHAGSIAFYCMWAFVFGLLVLGQIARIDAFADPKFNLIVPWLVGTATYVIMLWKGRYFATVRDETTRVPGRLKQARLEVLLGFVLFAAIIFSFKHFDIFSSQTGTVEEDIISAVLMSAAWSATMWFINARRYKSVEDTDND